MNLEKKILKHLLYDDEYVRKTLPFVKADYFSDSTERTVFQTITEYILKYNTSPTIDALKIEVDSIGSLNEEQYRKVADSGCIPTHIWSGPSIYGSVPIG